MMRISKSYLERGKKAIYTIAFIFVGFFPVISGFLYGDQIRRNTEFSIKTILNLGIEKLFTYNIDFWTISFWIMTLMWIPVYLWLEDRKLNIGLSESVLQITKLNELFEEQTKLREVYQNRSLELSEKLDRALEKLISQESNTKNIAENFHLKESLSRMESSISTRFFQFSKSKESKYKFIDQKKYSDHILSELNMIELAIMEYTRRYFKSDFDLGANFMIYFPSEDLELINSLTKDNHPLYFRDHNKDELLGVLYLVPELRAFLPRQRKNNRYIPRLVMPIYDPTKPLYCDPRFIHDEVIIPGATLAFFKDISLVKDTTRIDKDDQYKKLNQVTKQEITRYFSNDGRYVKCFASFGIPSNNYSPQTMDEAFSIPSSNRVGVFNIDSSKVNSFDGEEKLSNFMVDISPTLQKASLYLDEYRNFLKNRYLTY